MPDPANSLPNPLYQRLRAHFQAQGSQVDRTSEAAVFAALAQVSTVEDGDTWKGKRKPDPLTVIGPSWYRLVGIDTHETDGKHAQKGKREKQFTKDWVDQGRNDWTDQDGGDAWPFIVRFVDPQGEVEGTYGRALVDLVRRSDGASLKSSLLDWAAQQSDIKKSAITYGSDGSG